jgi:glycosyltransferase involved in cell wall biosynthesis
MISRYYYPHVGGVEKHLKNINTNLNSKGYKVKVITEKYNSNVKNREIVDGIEVLRIPIKKVKIIGLINIWIRLFGYINIINKSDIVHIHDVFIWYLPFRFIYPNKKVFITFHGYESYPVKMSAILIRKISELLTNGNICIGRFIQKWYKTKATFINYGAVDPRLFKPDNKNKYEYDAIFFGRLDEQTGILTYLKAAEIIKRKIPDFKLLVIGNGKYKDEAINNSTLLDFKDNPEIYIRKARFAFVSRYLSILEAFASKKLVFAVYDNPIKKDYLTDTPYKKWLIIVNSPEKLVRSVEYYLKNPDKANVLINRSYRWVKQNTWENLTNVYLNLWEL